MLCLSKRIINVESENVALNVGVNSILKGECCMSKREKINPKYPCWIYHFTNYEDWFQCMTHNPDCSEYLRKKYCKKNVKKYHRSYQDLQKKGLSDDFTKE